MRALILFIIGLTFGTGIGFILGTPTMEHDHAGHADMSHDHSTMIPWTGPAPDIALQIINDMGDARNLLIDATGFTFTPETVNEAPLQGTGHAHIYIDGVKVTRAYSPWMYLENAPSGAVIRVTFNANDHSAWALDGQPIAAEITVP